MDDHTFHVLEFDKILEMAAAYAITGPGKGMVREIRPLKSIDEIRRQIDLVSECRKVLSEGRSFGIEHFDDLSPLFKKIRPADSIVEPLDVRLFLPLFYSSSSLQLLVNDPSCPGIGEISSRLTTHPEVRKSVEKSIDRDGNISDGASAELSRIRQSIKSYERKIKGALDGILKRHDLAPHLQDFYLAERNNRWVIPVKIDSKGSVPGIVHDISNTGETVYVEPYSIQQIGNELESYRAEEKLEEYRILRRLSALLREHLSEIEEDYNIVAKVDSLQASALFASRMDMSPPEINEKGSINIVNGRHPLLWKTLKRENRSPDLVPLGLEIRREAPCMVITGSNAGGKTVALKTTGVLALMALSGMHTPAGSGTTFPFLEKVFADIGDEQSIEQNLSTFSAHVNRISKIIGASSSDTLVIIDELGTGTDPEQGGALSCAVLRRLLKNRALSIASTHLGMLKAFAHAQAGMVNSSMEMEEVTVNNVIKYRPTYKLVMGEPGTSYAIEIAETLGLQEDVVREARGIMAGEGIAIESLIADLKKKNREVDARLKETEGIKQDVSSIQTKLNEELKRINEMKDSTLSRAVNEAEELLRKTKSEARDIISAIKKEGKEKASRALKDLNRKHEELKKLKKLNSKDKLMPLNEVREGQEVFVHALKINGQVHSINEKTGKCKVLVEGKEIIVTISELSEPVTENNNQQTADISKRRHTAASGISEGMELERELNVIGQRVDPALSTLERLLNDAALYGVREIKIIHGIGTGILSSAIREYVSDHPLVESYRKGSNDEGGEAVTVVLL